MADLGAIGALVSDSIYSNVITHRNIQSATHPNEIMSLNGDVAGTISGIVKINNVAAVGVRVALVYRSNLLPIGFTFTDINGRYSFGGLNRNDTGSFMVIAIDPRETSPYNYTIVSDHLTPG